jgi:hypothetical protein
MSIHTTADSLHRLVKQAIDSGAASSIAEAEALFRGYRLRIEIDDDAVDDPAYQATLLTAVSLAQRVFLGGVSVAGSLEIPLAVPMPLGPTLESAIRELGATTARDADPAPTIVIGGGTGTRRSGFCIRTVVSGWRGGIVPIDSEIESDGQRGTALAGMLAAALAVNEAFLHVSGGASYAGHRAVGLSLWRPESLDDWWRVDASEPEQRYLPSRLWLLGLGHLGQAYLWALGLLPYESPEQVHLVLQDIDVITPSTQSTSILTNLCMVGKKKTRVMADWVEARGFNASVTERRFARGFKRHDDEPAVALCGLDNALGRRALDQVGFDFVVEAGLGRGHRNFRTLRLHVLPGRRSAAEIWRGTANDESPEDKPAYTKLLADGDLDRCGMTLLAGKAVGAPFVGATAAALAISEVLRLLHGGRVNQLIDLDLLCPETRTVSAHTLDFQHLNPGYSLGS